MYYIHWVICKFYRTQKSKKSYKRQQEIITETKPKKELKKRWHHKITIVLKVGAPEFTRKGQLNIL